MTNQQLKAHCEDVIANPKEHSEMVLAMAKALLPCLEAEPVVVRCRYHPTPQCDGRWIYIPQAEYMKDETGKYQEQALYTAPPVPELKSVELPEMIYVREPGFIGYVYDANEIEEALKRNGIEVKS